MPWDDWDIGSPTRGMNDGNAMAAEGMSPGRSSLDEHRFVVAGATLDELDQKYETGSNNISRDDDLSIASTVDVDNIHPYLMRYADMYAHDNSDASSVGTGPTFVDVKPPSQFKEGQKVLYTGNNGPREAIIIKVLYDDENQSHYTIKMASGKEKQTNSDKLNQHAITMGATDENGNVPTKCVDFRTAPTPLFQSLYQSKWKEAEQRLRSHPEEASIWVARYAKKSNGSNVRWQLLPLHLCIALGGASNGEATTEENNVPVDEKDEIMQTQEESTQEEKEGKKPPFQLLTALLSVYPQATQCTDDQNMIPLHSAIRGSSSLPIIGKLLEVDPSSVYKKDVRGRNAFILVEKVFGKRIHKERVGNEDKAREMKYAKLMDMLSDAARRVSSPTKLLQPKEKAQGVQKKQEEEVPQLSLQQLQNENLALSRENAMLHHRAEINERLLQQLVDKLQMYEEQRSVEIEFLAERRQEILRSISEDDDTNDVEKSDDGTFLAERRDEILLSISEDDDTNDVETNDNGKEQTEEEKQVGGHGGAYHKRLDRYLHSTPTKNKGKINIISPASTVTEATEPVSPSVPPSVLMPKFEFCDKDDATNTAGAEDSDGKIIKGKGEETKRGGTGRKMSCESDESSNTNKEGQDIFRLNDANTQDDTPAKTEVPNETVHQLDALVCEIGTTEADSATSQLESSAGVSEPAVAKETTDPKNTAASEVIHSIESDNSFSVKQNQIISATDVSSYRPAIVPVLSWEEEDQLIVE